MTAGKAAGRSMKRTMAVIAGVVVMLLGLAGAAAGATAIAVFGTEGAYRIPVADVRTEGAALYVRSFGLEQQVIPEGLLEVSLTARGESGAEVFLGVGPAAQVQAYLTGVPYDAAAELSNGAFVTNAVPGTRAPTPPGDQAFWLTQETGSPAVLSWQPSYRADILVVMNADASAPVAVQLSAELGSPRLFPAAVAAIGIGVALSLFGLWLLLRAGRRRSEASAD